MTRKDRWMVCFSTYFFALLGLFFFGTFAFFLLPVAAIIYLIMGGKKHV